MKNKNVSMYPEEDIIKLFQYIKSNGFNDEFDTIAEELDHLNEIGVIKRQSVPNLLKKIEKLEKELKKAYKDLQDIADINEIHE